MLRVLRSMVRFLSEIVLKEKEIYASFAIKPQRAQVMAMVCGKCFGKMWWKARTGNTFWLAAACCTRMH